MTCCTPRLATEAPQSHACYETLGALLPRLRVLACATHASKETRGTGESGVSRRRTHLDRTRIAPTFHGAPARVANLRHPYTVAPLAASAPDPKGRRQLVCMTRASSLARGLHPGRYIKKWLFPVLTWCTDARDHPGHYPPSSDLGHAPAYRGRHFLTQAVGAVGCDRHPASWRHHCARVRLAQRPFTGFRVSRGRPWEAATPASKEFRCSHQKKMAENGGKNPMSRNMRRTAWRGVDGRRGK